MNRGAAAGLTAAALFGASAPLSKALLPSIPPVLLAALLYLGAGLLLTAFGLVSPRPRGAPLRRGDAPRLLAIALLGGAVGPWLMLAGLSRTSAVTGSLMLNLEAPFTIALAVTAFGEHLGRRELGAAAAIVACGALLGLGAGSASGGDGLGAVMIAGACLAWGLDNNLSQRVSDRDPVAVVRVKALTAGSGMLLLAVARGEPWPPAALAGGALALGAVSYGASLLLDMAALRLLGAAREAAIFATAPFFGALLAIPVIGERPSLIDALGAGGMIAGVALLLRARHRHHHHHAEVDHEHLHVHDEHHQHAHEGPVTEPHSHPHHHAPLAHDHPHVSDAHHRHPHRG